MKITAYLKDRCIETEDSGAKAIARAEFFIRFTDGDIIIQVRRQRISLFADATGIETAFSIDLHQVEQRRDLHRLMESLIKRWTSQGSQRLGNRRSFLIQGEGAAIDLTDETSLYPDSVRAETSEEDRGFRALLGRALSEEAIRLNSPERLAETDNGWLELAATFANSDIDQAPRSDRVAA